MKTVEKILIHVLIAAIVIPLLIGLWWVLWPVPKLITFHEGNYVRPVYAAAGNHVSIYRDFSIESDVQVVIHRKLVKKDDDHTHIVNLPQVEQYYTEGDYKQVRQLRLPCELSAGEWAFENTVTYKDDYGRTASIPSPPISIQVTGNCYGDIDDDKM